MKSCSQPAYEQVSDAQRWTGEDKSLRFKIPSIKTQDEGRGKKKTQIREQGFLPTLNSSPDCVCLGLHLSPTSTPHLPVPATSGI